MNHTKSHRANVGDGLVAGNQIIEIVARKNLARLCESHSESISADLPLKCILAVLVQLGILRERRPVLRPIESGKWLSKKAGMDKKDRLDVIIARRDPNTTFGASGIR